MNRFKGTVALVTGVGRTTGIGAGIARRFAREGGDVAISDICADYKDAPGYGMGSWEQLNQTAEALRELGVKAVPIRCDVTDSEQVEAMIEKTVAELGRIDILVNNAGGSPGAAPVMMMEESAWRRTLDINATGAFLCSKAAAQRMIEVNLPLPAYEQMLKASHTFNLLDARRALSVTERQRYILRVRALARAVAESYFAAREKLGFPLLGAAAQEVHA